MDGIALAEPSVEGIGPLAGLPEQGVQERVEDVAGLHTLGNDGATDARQLSADAQRPCEAVHAVEPMPRLGAVGNGRSSTAHDLPPAARRAVRADTPRTSVTTLASLMFAVSRTFATRLASRARSSISRLR